jgi:hypothetical protein
MGNFLVNVADITQTFVNNILQEDQQFCLSTVNSSTNNNVVIITGSTIDGNAIGVQQTINTDASCLMVSNMDSNISNILSATLAQTNKVSSDLFNGFSFDAGLNSFDINQTVTNNISQVNEATCSASQIVSSSNNYVYVSNSTIKKNFVGVVTTSDSKANCTMSNSMKATTYNQAQASGTQSNTVSGMWAALMAAIVAIITIIIVGVVLVFGVSAVGYVGYTKAGGTGGIGSTLDAAQQLGLTPDVLASVLGTPAPTATGALAAGTTTVRPVTLTSTAGRPGTTPATLISTTSRPVTAATVSRPVTTATVSRPVTVVTAPRPSAVPRPPPGVATATVRPVTITSR